MGVVFMGLQFIPCKNNQFNNFSYSNDKFTQTRHKDNPIATKYLGPLSMPHTYDVILVSQHDDGIFSPG